MPPPVTVVVVEAAGKGPPERLGLGVMAQTPPLAPGLIRYSHLFNIWGEEVVGLGPGLVGVLLVGVPGLVAELGGLP